MKQSHIIDLAFYLLTLTLCPQATYGGTQSIAKEQRQPKLIKAIPPTYYGVLPKAVQISQPWQLINPFAPASFGYGRDTVSWSAKEAKPKGFIAFGVRFW